MPCYAIALPWKTLKKTSADGNDWWVEVQCFVPTSPEGIKGAGGFLYQRKNPGLAKTSPAHNNSVTSLPPWMFKLSTGIVILFALKCSPVKVTDVDCQNHQKLSWLNFWRPGLDINTNECYCRAAWINLEEEKDFETSSILLVRKGSTSLSSWGILYAVNITPKRSQWWMIHCWKALSSNRVGTCYQG